MKIQFNEKTDEWEKLPDFSEDGYYIDGMLWNILNNVFLIIRKNFDCVFLIDGMEGTGKSILGIFLGYVLSKGKLQVNNIAEDCDDAIRKLEGLPNKSVIIIDEGGLMFSSTEVMKKEQRKLVKILNVIRQKQMILIIVSPSFFNLNKYVSVERSRFLLHVYTDEQLNRGRFAYFGFKTKRKLFTIGKKCFNSYAKPKSDFIGVFRDFNPTWYDEYLKTKQKSLLSALHEDVKLDRVLLEKEKTKKIIYCIEQYPFKEKIIQEEKAKMIGITFRTYQEYIRELKEEGLLEKKPKYFSQLTAREVFLNNLQVHEESSKNICIVPDKVTGEEE